MPNNIILKKSSTNDKVPLPGDLQYGELALNFADGNLFYKNSANAITTIASNKTVSVTGNVTGGNIVTSGIVSATSSLNTAGNINFTNAEASDAAKIYANVSGATTSLVLEVADDLATDRIVLRHRYFATANTVDMLSAQLSGNTEANVTVTGNLIATNQVIASGNITGGNLNITGNIVDTGALTIITGASGNVSLAPNGTNVLVATTTGANITGTLNATGNIIGGNITTAGVITATGNITGGNITTAGIANVATLEVTALANIKSTTAATSTTTGALRTAGGVGVAGNVHVGGALVATTKSFAIQHPDKKDTILYHGCLEGPEHAVYTRGRCTTDTIVLPDYWTNLVDSDSITVHLTAIGECNTVKVVTITSDAVIIQGSPAVDCFYIIHATRCDVPALDIEVPGSIQDLYRDRNL
jgi:hypothetical protein